MTVLLVCSWSCMQLVWLPCTWKKGTCLVNKMWPGHKFQPHVLCRTLLLLQESNETFLDNQFEIKNFLQQYWLNYWCSSSTPDRFAVAGVCCPPSFVGKALGSGCDVSWIWTEENFFLKWRKKQQTIFFYYFFFFSSHSSDSCGNSRNIYTSAVWILKDTYPNCNMKKIIISHLWNLPRLVWLWLPVALVQEHAIK